MNFKNIVVGTVCFLMASTLGWAGYRDLFMSETIIAGNTIEVLADVAVTLTQADCGSTQYQTDANGGTTTLMAVSDGCEVTFIIGAAYDTANWVVDSAEGDNITGSLIVNSAVVACAAEDQLNFVADGESLGDQFTIKSDGSNWYITGGNVITAAKLTCTDPS
ncbi:MAG: hypothetical protein KAS32_29805 [Candidatus Peribacteraceae bacterium]|nr:hypothetical protein [Candidatus Peribacteraceae bacterium]